MIYAHPHGGMGGLGYDVHGEGPAVLLLHPFPFDRRYWSELLPALGGYRVITVDARGFGDSAAADAGYGVDDLAEDAIALLDHLGVITAAVVGLSMGGYVALALCARHPARLSALALVDTRAGADGEGARANRDAAAAQVKAHGAASYLDGVAVRLCGSSASDAMRADVQALAESSSREFSRALPATLLALRDRPDRAALLPTLRLPTLVVVGAEDAVTPPDEARAMSRTIPGAALVEIAGAGHLSSRERPKEFSGVLRKFLDETLRAE